MARGFTVERDRRSRSRSRKDDIWTAVRRTPGQLPLKPTIGVTLVLILLWLTIT